MRVHHTTHIYQEEVKLKARMPELVLRWGFYVRLKKICKPVKYFRFVICRSTAVPVNERFYVFVVT